MILKHRCKWERVLIVICRISEFEVKKMNKFRHKLWNDHPCKFVSEAFPLTEAEWNIRHWEALFTLCRLEKLTLRIESFWKELFRLRPLTGITMNTMWIEDELCILQKSKFAKLTLLRNSELIRRIDRRVVPQTLIDNLMQIIKIGSRRALVTKFQNIG